MNRRTVLVAALLAGLANTLVAAPMAHADSPALGGLALSPTTGADISPIRLTTISSGSPKGCPSATTVVTGIAKGPGGWADGLAVVGNSSAGISTTADFSVDMNNSFKGTADDNGTVVSPGKYTIVLTCQNKLGSEIYGRFSGSVWFTDGTHYQSTDPATSTTTSTTSLTADPADRQEVGSPVTLTAAVTPATARGSVQFQDTRDNTVTPVGSPATLTQGVASVTTATLGVGLHTLTAVYLPGAGDSDITSTSPAITLVMVQPDPPTANGPATLSGAPRIGAVLQCSGSFVGADSISYGWLRDGQLLEGATDAQYRVGMADAPHQVACRASGTNTGGTVYRDSAAVTIPLGVALRPSLRPSLVGTFRPGGRLTVRVGSWSPVATAYRLQWRRNGRPIAGSSGPTFLLGARDAGQRISVDVLARRPGYADGRYSTPAATVARR